MDQPASLNGTDAPDRLTNAAGGYIVLRSALPPEQMEQTLRATVAEVDPMLALKEVHPMADALANIEAPRRFNTGLIGSFALGALLLAVSGIYAVVAFSVTLRVQEIAIRMALGAERGKIARMVLAGGVKLALLGCGLGVAGSMALSRIVSSFSIRCERDRSMAVRVERGSDAAVDHGGIGASGGASGGDGAYRRAACRVDAGVTHSNYKCGAASKATLKAAP